MKHYINYGVIVGLCFQSIAALDINRLGFKDERQPAYNRRILDAYNQTLKRSQIDLAQGNNGDLDNVANFGASFTKLFEHDSSSSVLTTVGQLEYKKFLKALNSGKQSEFNAVNLASGNVRVFVNPQAGCAFGNDGSDSSLFSMPKAPNLSSGQMAADMLEVYGMMICRDIRFQDYGTGNNEDDNGSGGSTTADVASVLNSLGSNYTGPRNQFNNVDASVLFRGSSAGDLVGPYISQFLIQPLFPLFPAGCAPFVAGLIGVPNLDQDILAIPQRIPVAQKREFGVSWDDFIALQNGQIPKEYAVTDYSQVLKRYPIVGRDMGSYVHTDSPYEPYYNALNILIYRGFPISPIFPYANGSIINEGAGITMGAPDAFALIGGVMLAAFKAAWCQKWRVNLQLRPECVAGLTHQVKETGLNPYNLHQSLFDVHAGIDMLALVLARNQLQATVQYDPQQLLTPAEASTYLLSQMYPEGSPAHPAYPSGHATVAGACTTVIKAIFKDTEKLITHLDPAKPNPADPTLLVVLSGEGESEMTVGSELDKLASNVALARNFGGVHFRADGEQGILLGEAVAICYLQTRASQYFEQGFTGFELTKRDGTRIRITKDAVTVI